MSVPNSLDGGLTNTLSLGHTASAPVGGTLRLGLGCHIHDVGDSLWAIERTTASARLDIGQSIDSTLQETFSPQDHCRTGGSQLRSL